MKHFPDIQVVGTDFFSCKVPRAFARQKPEIFEKCIPVFKADILRQDIQSVQSDERIVVGAVVAEKAFQGLVGNG